MSKRKTPKGDDQLSFFSAIYSDIPIRDQRDTMERPFFSLSKKKRLEPISYEVNGVQVNVYPNAEYGMATIWDADILIWFATQLREQLDRGKNVSPTIHFHPYDLLKGVRRDTGGVNYKRLKAALQRLAGTMVSTNIRADNKTKQLRTFHWLEAWDAIEDEESGNIIQMSVTLPKWLYEGIVGRGGVLTIDEDYFLLTGGMERWLYRVARKHAGNQDMGWQFTMRQLYEKSGTTRPYKDFSKDLRKIFKADALPEYYIETWRNQDKEEVISFARRSNLSFEDPRYQEPRIKQARMLPDPSEL